MKKIILVFLILFTSQSITQLNDLTRTVSIDVRKSYIYQYPHKEISKHFYKYSSQNSVKVNICYELEVNNGFLLAETVEQEWNNESWINARSTAISYNNNYFEIQWLCKVWDNSTWNNDWKEERFWDENNNNNLELKYLWSGSAWINDKKRTRTYDDHNNLIVDSIQIWEELGWRNYRKKLCSYDDQGNRIVEHWHIWQDTEWENDTKLTYSFDENSNRIELLLQTWEPSITEFTWMNTYRFKYKYDGNNMIEELDQYWDRSTNSWESYYKLTYRFNEYDKWHTILGEYFDGSQWKPEYRSTCSFDNNNNRIERIEQRMEGSLWINLWKSKFSYLQITGIHKSNKMHIAYSLSNNYPNPFNPSTTIKYSISKLSNVTLKVFDLLGSEVATLVNKEQQQGHYEVEFNPSADRLRLTSGVYLYRLQAGDYVETKKMMLIK